MSNRPKVKPTAPPPKKRRSAASVVTAPLNATSRLDQATLGDSGGQRTWWIVGAVVVVVVVALVVVLASGSDDANTATSPKAAAELAAKVTSVKASVFDKVGAGSMAGTIAPITGEKALTKAGKPWVVYIGAEYCPYCATERWAMVLALSRFGTFSNLGVTHSSGTDVYPNTPTFSFHGSTFTSKYLAFDGVETLSNVVDGSSYKKLDDPTKQEETLIDTYDAAPYVPANSAGSIPFMDIGNRYVLSGATYQPQVLQGRSADSIAAALADPTSDISKGAVGSANVLTAAICSITKQQPSTVCASAGVTAAKPKLTSSSG
jgi:hypothetical protein